MLLADLGLRKAAEGRAFIKLLATLLALSRRDAEDIRQGIHIDSTLLAGIVLINKLPGCLRCKRLFGKSTNVSFPIDAGTEALWTTW
jgi:hypothetical protein